MGTRGAADDRSPRLPAWRLAAVSAFWFGTGAQIAALTFVLVPIQIVPLVGDARKGTAVGVLVLAGALVSLLSGPLVGAWSDRTRTRWGRRVPFLIVGSLLEISGLLAMAAVRPNGTFSPLVRYGLSFLTVQVGHNLAYAPNAALVPDLVGPAQRGAASAWAMVMNLLGAATGAGVGALLGRLGGATGAYRALAVLVAGCAAMTVAAAREPEPPAMPPFDWRGLVRQLREPFAVSRDFRWVFGTRFLFTMGIFTVQAFLLFYLKDVVGSFRIGGRIVATTAEQAVTIFLTASLGGAVLSAPLGGFLSDRYGRRRIVFASSALQAMVTAVFLATSSFGIVLAAGVAFGIGMGAYQSSDWALATDVLPSAADHARDMGTWNIALVAPQLLATPVGGVVLDGFQRAGRAAGLPGLGYTMLFGMAVLYFVLGTVFVSRIRVR